MFGATLLENQQIHIITLQRAGVNDVAICPDNWKYWRDPRQLDAFLLDFMRISRLPDSVFGNLNPPEAS